MHNEQAERYFEGFQGARAILDAVLDGEQEGCVLAGASGAVVAHHEGWIFLGGEPEPETVNLTKRLIGQADGGRVYCVPMSRNWEESLVGCDLMCAPRCYLKRINLQPPCVNLPGRFVLERLTSDNLASALKLYNIQRAAAAWGGADELLDRSFGYLVVDEEADVASAAVAYAVSRGRVEVSIATEPAFKGQGLAKCASSALIGECDVRELQADWNCFSDSAASVAIAMKLGFEPKCNYRTLIRRHF